MSTVAVPATSRRARVAQPSPALRSAAGYSLLALLAYVPVLRTAPGRVAADTKQYLYLDPGRLLERAATMWDPNVGMGTVTHQTIGYLFPMGPFYWTLERLGSPDWVAQRLWLGSIVFAAGAGVLYLLRTFGLRGPGVVIAALAYMLSPYSLDYAARISVLLMPWAALPWMIGLVRKALRDGGWRYPAIFALVVQVVGGVNATALIFAGVGPVLWILYSWAIARDVDWRRAVGVTLKTGVLTLLTSLWWIAGLSIQGGYGLNILKYTETVEAVARTSTPNEVLRGLGYWFFYGQDRLGPWIEAAENYTQTPVVLFAGYALASLALLAAGLVRWRHRAFFVLLALVGVVIAVGAHPYGSPTPLGAVFKAFATSSTAGLALRSTARAVPLVVLATAILLGLGTNAVYETLRRNARPRLAAVCVALVAVLVFVNFPALVDGTWYGENLQRDEDVPAYWREAAEHLDAGDHATRVLELPGADFASYRWGNTVDPITPGLVDRPYVARELIPYGSPGTADLLNALDRRIQEGVLDPDALAPLLRRMGVGDVVARNDIQYERYDLVSTRELARVLASAPGLGAATSFGPPAPPVLARPHEDEKTLAAPAGEPPSAPVVVYPVRDPVPIVRAESPRRALMVAGDGEGLVDTAAVGLLDGAGVVQYSASYPDPDALRAAVGEDTVLVLTDSNRRRARRWTSVRDNVGVTERPGEEPLSEDLGDARLDVFPGATDASRTTVEHRGARAVSATGYGNTITYTPEDSAAKAFDGDLDTDWRAGAFGPGIGHRLRLELEAPITSDRVNLVQPQIRGRDRYVTEVELRFDGGEPVRARLDASSRTPSGQTVWFDRRSFDVLEIEITDLNVGDRRLHGGANAVGFAEVRVRDVRADRDVRVDEVVHMPTDLLDALGARSLDNPLVILASRERVVNVPPRRGPEPAVLRAFELPTPRAFSVTGTARISSEADHDAIARALGLPRVAGGGVSSDASEFLPGCVGCRADAAIDGDPTTAWQTPFVRVRGQWVEYEVPEPMTVDRLDLAVVADGRHSVPTRLRVQVDGSVRDVPLPAVADVEGENATVPVSVSFPAMTGRTIRVSVVDVREATTFDFYSGSYSLLPVAIAELGVPGLQQASVPAQLPGECRRDLLAIDGAPFAVRVTGAVQDAVRAGALGFEACDPGAALRLAAGVHEIAAAPGAQTGIQVDRVVLASGPGGDPLAVDRGDVVVPGGPPAASPTVTVVDGGRTRMRVRVEGAGEAFWLVLGQSRSDGWTARIDGEALGKPRLVDGYANGWYVDPAASDFDVVLEWTPQRGVRASITISIAAGVMCLAIAAFTWWRRRAALALVTAPDVDDARVRLEWPIADPVRRASAPVLISVALGTGTFAAVVAAPWIGVVVALATAAALTWGRARFVLAILPAVLIALAGAYMVVGQVRHEFPPIFEWPTLFPRARSLAWLAVTLLVARIAVDLVAYRDLPPASARDDQAG